MQKKKTQARARGFKKERNLSRRKIFNPIKKLEAPRRLAVARGNSIAFKNNE